MTAFEAKTRAVRFMDWLSHPNRKAGDSTIYFVGCLQHARSKAAFRNSIAGRAAKTALELAEGGMLDLYQRRVAHDTYEYIAVFKKDIYNGKPVPADRS
jgi:hypothetical protein